MSHHSSQVNVQNNGYSATGIVCNLQLHTSAITYGKLSLHIDKILLKEVEL